MWRVRAELAANEASGCAEELVVDAFQRSLAISREQRARAWELRGAVGLARHWTKQGQRQRARDLLTPVHATFTEGSETVDLREAQALLRLLANT